MTVTEAVKDTVKDVMGSGEQPGQLRATQTLDLDQRSFQVQLSASQLLTVSFSATARATREQMSEARLPLQYRDSCAHLLIPLNRCRFEEYYLPWKCVV